MRKKANTCCIFLLCLAFFLLSKMSLGSFVCTIECICISFLQLLSCFPLFGCGTFKKIQSPVAGHLCNSLLLNSPFKFTNYFTLIDPHESWEIKAGCYSHYHDNRTVIVTDIYWALLFALLHWLYVICIASFNLCHNLLRKLLLLSSSGSKRLTNGPKFL